MLHNRVWCFITLFCLKFNNCVVFLGNITPLLVYDYVRLDVWKGILKTSYVNWLNWMYVFELNLLTNLIACSLYLGLG